jgi:hypothetical protein
VGRRRLFAGDRVVVRSPEEILATLDADGTLRGLPFMPEMLPWCGKVLRVERRVEKICVDRGRTAYIYRRFPDNDVVILEDLRCDGQAHDGCSRCCKMLWREDWLRRLEPHESPVAESPGDGAALRRRLRTKADEHHYVCQSTELRKATEEFPGRKKPWMARVLFQELRNGDRSLPEVLRLIAAWTSLRLQQAMHGKSGLVGSQQKTPSASLGLRPGESVRIKSRDDIRATLNAKRTNRGMGICHEMTRYCGGQAEVRVRLERMISEQTGEMRTLTDTVILRNVRGRTQTLSESGCLCEGVLGDCPRGELMYWREIWLERE